MRSFARVLALTGAALLISACQERRPPRGPGPGQWQVGGQPPPQGWGQPPPPQGWGQPPPPPGWGQPPPPPQGWGQPPPPVPGFAGSDPINNLDMVAIRQRAGNVLGELVAALADGPRGRVTGIPLVTDPTPGDVNAFAACEKGKALMGITDGLLEVMAFSARFKANDEIFGTRLLDAYTKLVGEGIRPNKPLPRPGAGFIDPGQDADGRKIARQNQLLDAQLAFVLGHELAHHHLGHTGCVGGGGLSISDIGNVLSRAVPVFNQPAEIGADVSGTHNLLAAGARRQGAKWNEEGAMLSLNFFAALDRFTPADIVLGFERTHPHPNIRMPIVQNAATNWRVTGGNPIMIPGF